MENRILIFGSLFLLGLGSGCSNIQSHLTYKKEVVENEISFDSRSQQQHPEENLSDITGVPERTGFLDPLLLYETEDERRVLLRVRKGDTLSQILGRSGAEEGFLSQLSIKNRKKLSKIYPNDVIEMTMDQKNIIKTFAKTVRGVQDRWLVVNRNENDSYSFSNKTLKATYREHYAKVDIKQNLTKASYEANIELSVANKMIEIMKPEIDLEKQSLKGDSFQIAYRQMQLDDRPVGEPVILGARYNHKGKQYSIYRYQDKTGFVGYYDDHGDSLNESFLKSPLEYRRISSEFQKSRYHPVLKKTRAHEGVDLVADSGTKIVSPGNGVVSFIGRKGGYGNVVEIQHPNGIQTVYAHLSKFKGGMAVGDSIKQNEIIAYVGSTGLSTGPHLHYEIRINGKPVDPMRTNLSNNQTLVNKELSNFKKSMRKIGFIFENLDQNRMITHEWNVENENIVI